MLASVFTKAIRDRQISTVVGAVGVVMVAVLGLGAYADLDQEIVELFDSLPAAFVQMVGIGGATGAGSLILAEIANLMAPIVLAGLAISMGAAAVAGEERKGTFGILLGNPKSRQNVVASKAAAMVVLVAVGAVLSGVGSLAVARAFDTDTTGLHMTAAMVHVAAISLFFGFLALFLGSWTGNASVASGTSTGVLLISFLAAGLLPLIEDLADLAKAFPWYYFNGSQPLRNGIDWGHLAVLGVGCLVFGGAALVGVARRDLKVGAPSGLLMSRLREHPKVRRLMERIAGRVNVSTITVKATTDHRTMMVIAGVVLLYVAMIVGPMYNALSDVLVDFSQAIPEALRAMIGHADMGTPEGWLVTEVFSITVPATLIAVAVVIGGRALAGEEEDRTMDLLLANPVPRSRVVLEKAAALAIVVLVLGIANALGVWFGSLIGGLGVSPANIFATSMLGAVLGIFFGYVALAISAGVGSRRIAALATAGLALVAYFANAFLPASAGLKGWARVSPFYYYTVDNPLAEGLRWGNLGVLVLLSVVALGIALPLFQRRDVHG